MTNRTTEALELIGHLRADVRELTALSHELRERIIHVEDEHARYEKALREIAGEDSGVWGRLAWTALRGER